MSYSTKLTLEQKKIKRRINTIVHVFIKYHQGRIDNVNAYIKRHQDKIDNFKEELIQLKKQLEVNN